MLFNPDAIAPNSSMYSTKLYLCLSTKQTQLLYSMISILHKFGIKTTRTLLYENYSGNVLLDFPE